MRYTYIFIRFNWKTIFYTFLRIHDLPQWLHALLKKKVINL